MLSQCRTIIDQLTGMSPGISRISRIRDQLLDQEQDKVGVSWYPVQEFD